MKRQIPVYVISGFLGSGKTTVLLKMIQEFTRKGQTPGIILNELGEINVENHMFEGQNVRELLNGCICCTIQDDLIETLNYFIDESQNQRIDALFIEGTGVANPVEIEEKLLSPMFIDYFEIKSMISLVDASHFLEYQTMFSTTSQVRKLLQEQITSATLLIFNKMDLVNEKAVKKIIDKVEQQVKQNVPIIHTSFGDVPIDKLFMKRYLVHTVQSSGKDCGCDGHDHTHKHNHSSINAIRIEQVPVMNRIKLEKWLKKLPSERLLRGKGMIRIDESPGFFNFQFASGRLMIERMRERPSSEPTIILIGDSLNPDEILTQFNHTFHT